MFPSQYDCPFCSSICDVFDDHQVECGGNKDRIYRHDTLRDVLFTLAQAVALAPRREVLSLIPSFRSRPADIFLPVWIYEKPTVVDLSVISPRSDFYYMVLHPHKDLPSQ